MQIDVTDRIRALLVSVTESRYLPSVAKREAASYLSEERVPFSLVKSLCTSLREESGDGPWVQDVCSGARLVLKRPEKRKRSPELLKRLEQLQREEEERKYQAMVRGVAKGESEDTGFTLLPSFRLQLSFGAHVLLTMFVFYLLGSYSMKAFSGSPALQALGGALGLTFGLILETSLFMIRSLPTELGSSSSHER